MSITGVVALIAAKDACPEIRDTVRALFETGKIDSVLVIDDGSKDETARYAEEAGALVLRLEANVGKAAAIQRGVSATPEASIYLLVDADTGHYAARAAALVDPIESNAADLVIGALPPAGTLGGFGLVKGFAAWGIRRGCGFAGHAPLSGQRAVRGRLLRSLAFASRFGLEVGMTIDAARAGARIVEIEVDMQHRHRGRRASGFLHRGRQGFQIASAFWPRLVPRFLRIALIALLLVCVGYAELNFATRNYVSAPNPSRSEFREVPVYVIPGWSWNDVDSDQLKSGVWGSMATGNDDDIARTLSSGSKEASAPRLDIRLFEVESFDAAVAAAGGDAAYFVGVDPPGDARELRPLWLPQTRRPWLTEYPKQATTMFSASTKRLGLVDPVDLAPTVLEEAGRIVPLTVQGQSVWSENVDPSFLPDVASQVHLDNRWRPFVIGALTVLVLAAAALAALRLRGSAPFASKWRSSTRWVALVLTAVPLATYIIQLIGTPISWGIVGRSTLLAVIVVMILGMAALAAPSTWVSLRRILTATVFLLLADLLLGTPLQLSGIFGSDPTLGSRYYGLGNPASVLLLTTTILLVTLHVQASSNRRSAVARGSVLLFAVTLADGLPGLGSDVGGMLGFLLTSGIAIILLAEVRLSVPKSIALSSIALAAFLIAGLLDASRPPAAQTHLGRLFTDIGESGLMPLFDVVFRKVEANFLSYAFPWSLLLLASAVTSLLLLWRTNVWSDLLPVGSAARAGAGLAVLGGLLLFALNDSGIVVLALVSVYLIPFVLVQERLTYGQSSGHLKLEVSTK